MNFSSHALAILALLATSMTVRVLPVFVRVRLGTTARGLLERVLPMAVFLNFAVYIAWTEIHAAPAAAVAAIAIAAIVTFSTRAGLVLTTCAATLVYVLVRMSLHG
ncbi:MAG TPA: hypothetical protein VF446_20035 [Trinickia sp.]